MLVDTGRYGFRFHGNDGWQAHEIAGFQIDYLTVKFRLVRRADRNETIQQIDAAL